MSVNHNSNKIMNEIFVILLFLAGMVIPCSYSQHSTRMLHDEVASSKLKARVPNKPFGSSPSLLKDTPKAKKVKHVMEKFGDVRIDNYYWLRDDNRTNPEVLAYLHAENNYTAFLMSDSKHLQDQILSELRGRIREDDISAPRRRGPYYYYERNLKGKEYLQYCRRLAPNNGNKPSVYDVMPTGPDSSPEHVIIDENLNALGHDFYNIGTYTVSPNHKLVAYTEDTKGNEIYTVFVIDAESRNPVGKSLVGVTSDIVWAGDEALLYVTMDATSRADKVWLHKLGQEQSSDLCLYHEKDEMFSLGVELSENKKFVFVSSTSKTTSFVYYLNIEKLENGIIPVTPRVDGVETEVGYRGNHFFITRKTKELYNSELLVCPVNNVSAITVILPHRESVTIQEMQLYSDHLVLLVRENGLLQVNIYNLPPVGEQVQRLERPRAVKFMDPVYTVQLTGSQFNFTILRYQYSSLRTPYTQFDYDMNTGTSVMKWNQTVLGGFDSSKYITERKWATAQDGIRVPISIVYRKDLAKLDGSDPMHLEGYGSYGSVNDPDFSASRLSLLNRGFIYAIAHVRGGGEMGSKWYENGKFLKKKNTFTDFIACAEYLIKNKYTIKEKLSIYGASAGGMLIGAVVNMRPDLFKAAIAGVPFVDVLTTMLDPTIPLTTSEYQEWGDPRKEEFYRYIKSYSPVDNISAQKYPSLLVTAGLNDARVLYSEPAKFVAKLRDMKTDNNILLFKTEFGAGHFSKSGRFEKLEKDGLFFTFILKALNMNTGGEGLL